MNRQDILIFVSDQHHANYAGFAGHSIVRTPHLDQLAADGVVMKNAYTSAPLCVPARVAMLTGQMPETTGIYTNNGAMGGTQTTFLHSIAAEGYETVLCGRMHFLGEDQRHGFTKRIMGEMTPLFWGRYGESRADLGPYVGTMANQNLKIVGGGISPVLAYDEAVIKAALDYLDQDHDKPQCIVVGTYGPHHTYVAPPEKYAYYKECADIPLSFHTESDNPILAGLRQEQLNEQMLRKVRAAYLGMVETLDGHVGKVRAAWDAYLKRQKRQGMFLYLSDHGEQAGEHGLVGKQTFYEGSAKIPMIFAGDGVLTGHTLSQPVSIMDVGPTLCELIRASDAPPRPDGKSILQQIAGGEEELDRIITSEMMYSYNGKFIPGRMLRKGKWKYIAYAFHHDFDQLFDLESDPQELRNLRTERPEITELFMEHLLQSWNAEAIAANHLERSEHYKLLNKWGRAVDVPEPERWAVPSEATCLPIME